MKYFFTLIALFNLLIARAQFETGYEPCALQDTVPPSVYEALEAVLEKDKAAIESPRSKEGSYIRSLYQKRFEFVVGQFNQDYFIADSELTAYLQKVLLKIYDANPNLKIETDVYVHRSAAPNAVSFGEGTIGFTLGLLSRMENEAEVAYVLCHELAHHHVGHSGEKIRELARLTYDKDFNKQMRDIRSSEYGKYTKYTNLMKGLGFSVNKHSREDEFEADSMGLVYYANMQYDLAGAVRTIAILDSVDVSKYRNLIDFRKHFDFAEFPFKDNWLDYTKSDTWYASTNDSGDDTTKTHPSCQKRIEALNRQIARMGGTTGRRVGTGQDNTRLAITSDFELIESSYHFKQYGRAMFDALLMLEYYPDNAYLHAMVGKCLYRLYQSQKNHELGKVLALPDPRFEENYDRFLTFIHSLRLHELASLTYYYMIHGKEPYFSNEHYVYSLWLCADLEMSRLDRDKIREEYEAMFPKGRYRKAMKKQ